MHAAVVEVLIGKSRFEPQVALGIAEAIDMAIQNAELVTVPILDARVAALQAGLEARIKESAAALNVSLHSVKAELVRRVFLVMLGNIALTSGITAVLNAYQR